MGGGGGGGASAFIPLRRLSDAITTCNSMYVASVCISHPYNVLRGLLLQGHSMADHPVNNTAPSQI